MLKTKLFKAFALLAILIGVLSAIIGIQIIKSRIVDEAQRRVQLDLSSAWAVYDAEVAKIETIMRLAAGKEVFHDLLNDGKNGVAREHATARLQLLQANFDLDFMTVVDSDGKVVLRGAPPHMTGDIQYANKAVLNALQGSEVSGTMLLSHAELEKEADGLAEQAFIVLEETPRARPTPKTEEARGMVMIAAVPVVEGMQVIGAIYGGVALNRNEDIVDQIQDVVYGDEEYNGAPLGTTTIFLKDSRITTTVRRPNGNRAIGTRVSREVAERVLDNGRPWIDRAFVVSDWYLSAYEPIKNLEDEVIGILYVGILEEPFNQLGRQIMLRYAGLLAFSLAAALVIAFVMAGRVAQPIHRLVEATKSMQRGEPHTHVPGDGTCAETESLIHGFNDMAEALEEREARLQEANGDLTALNRSYMDMLGFVSHELKSPVSSIMNYVYLLRQEKIGPMTEKQAKAAKNIETNSKRIVEMVRHYLNLSRIETGELQPVMTTIHVLDDLLQPLLESLEGDVEACGMSVKNDIDTSVVIHADANMAREAFENLVSNAVKYGRNGTEIQISADADEDFVTFRVANEGEGIRADQIEHLFDKFSRLEGEDAVRRQKGTGLGLFITKHIVEAHGGIIKVESTPGEWTVFTFSLPREKNPEEA